MLSFCYNKEDVPQFHLFTIFVCIANKIPLYYKSEPLSWPVLWGMGTKRWESAPVSSSHCYCGTASHSSSTCIYLRLLQNDVFKELKCMENRWLVSADLLSGDVSPLVTARWRERHVCSRTHKRSNRENYSKTKRWEEWFKVEEVLHGILPSLFSCLEGQMMR